jgi:outer membrane receptor protein involved in Fe transport
VLVDGRRAQPANALLVVNVNTIPSAAIESVEVISGGASATYGADAIGGVTNFILKKDFEGFSLSVQGSDTEQGGGGETRISALMGANFGNGNVMLGLEGSERQEIRNIDRDFYLDGYRDPRVFRACALRHINLPPRPVHRVPKRSPPFLARLHLLRAPNRFLSILTKRPCS